MLTSFLAPPPLATFFASAKTPTEKFQARAKAGFGIALTYCLFFCPGATLAQNYIPATTALVNLNRGKVCAIGSSMSGTFKNNNNSINVGPYYLTKNNQQLGVWQPVTSSTQSVSALEVGSDVTAIQTSPGDQPYINSAVIRFFIIDNPNSKNCSDITFTFANTTTGALNVSYYPYPHALFEMSAYPQGSASVLTVDISNVDSFEAPLMMKVSNGSTAFAEIGNPVYSARAARTTMITGPHDVGGPNSPFVVWLHGQPGYANGPNFFANLALSSAPTSPERYPYALLQSPNGYLSARCTPFNNGFVPPSCNLSNSLLHRSDPLNSFFDNQLTNFFSNAYANPSAPLVVMGDASGIITQQPWTATSNTANCPVYINPDGKSLAMTTQAGTIVICNPVGQVVTLAGQPIGYNQQSALVEISQQQYLAYMKYKGWMFGQPETGFTGTVSQFVAQGGKYYIALIGTNGAPNLSYPVWVFSNINVKAYSGLNWYETASQMVFANDGAFNPWIAAYISNSDLSVVAQSIGRNIVAAFSRGIANCNNVTMASSQPPGFCSNVTKSSTIIPMAANASDAYWSNEANWYPVNGVQDYYVQYIHAARLDNQGNIVPGPTCPTSGCFNIFAVPNGAIPNGVANSNQGLPMGMGYGFGYDENPVYVSGPAQVPSKLDPIPTAWGTGLSLAVIIGRSQPSQGAAHDFNADGKSDVLWYNTSSGQVLEWLIDAATVIGGGSPGTAASPWAIVGQRDFNGDGYGDILWRNGSTGQVLVWLLNGATVIGGGSPGAAASPWTVAGTGDFNGDGYGDILWYNTSSGQAVVWLLNGATVIGGGSPGSAASPWTVAGTGDFNGDGMSDILWYNTGTGQALVWLLNGAALIGGGSPGSAASPWIVAGTGDFNGDGMSDILWYNTSAGQALVWLLNGTAIIGGGSPGSAASPWTIIETGDFNGDGMSDVLWYNTGSGQLVVWLINSATVIGGGSPGSAASPWQIQGMNAD